MRKLILIIVGLLSLMTTSCVQKTYKRTVNFIIDVSKVENIKNVGIRGEKPLDWNYDTKMTVVKKDSLYKATVIFETGYKFVEIKFTVNSDFELKEKDNRKVYFSENDTTFYDSKFNVVK